MTVGSKKVKGTGKRVKDHGVKVGANKVTKEIKTLPQEKNKFKPTTGRGDMENGAVKIRSEGNNRGTRLREVEYELSDHSRGRTVIGYKTYQGSDHTLLGY